jgi:hypothetical protein
MGTEYSKTLGCRGSRGVNLIFMGSFFFGLGKMKYL